MSAVTTHVLDLSRGRPAAGVAVTLHRRDDDGAWIELGRSCTDDDGRVGDLLPGGAPAPVGEARLTFETGAYFSAHGVAAFHPSVVIAFRVTAATEHYHVPVLLSPFGYTTYRGS